MRPSDSSKPSNVARVETIEGDSRGANVRVHARWYYRPEESIGGQRQFHGSKEFFLSDHYDVQSADTIEGKCTVHTFKGYTKLDAVGNDDFFCRFEFNWILKLLEEQVRPYGLDLREKSSRLR
ncbi:hypothetical protein RHSIM_Rhsim11G0073500 [Rhododendron simsii]|uniref:BAH domain-containing protein n=1 Tax=Rhododendron simsii TaxID=118357 RepID=A0A834G804_RHOSS|nr:hypothetical protein RHSIM_Rhsim11G0073500 [Rhododendron simsii]